MSSNFAMSLNSPFSDRLRKNYIAPPEEEAGIETVFEHKRTLIRDLDIELKDIDKAMKTLVVRKGAILCRRHAHQTFVDDHQFLLSGILHLPEDVLSKISEDLLPSDGEYPSYYSDNPDEIHEVFHKIRPSLCYNSYEEVVEREGNYVCMSRSRGCYVIQFWANAG
ncbi:hypothetical protein FA13DRAFT_1777727 [Coprinellus micaceus]|uniref:Uncharacterized protein n=1 Tax=Coprinellus micaceus TaxID=71717 RepID=A0A4Y7SSL2_COPMI|nr:hypothetical protein FA13DRAFT_1777727 [Coprinellus micaceus]